MGRKTKHKIGDFHGKLEVIEIIPTLTTGKHIIVKCFCHYCGGETTINGNLVHKMNSCGCQKHNTSTWKSVGPKTKPWQLPSGVAARNNLEFQYKRGAKKRSLVYELTTEEFTNLVTGECVYCGDKQVHTQKGQGKTSGDFHYTGIDRVNSSKGYTLDNCVPCCWLCNNMKSNTEESVFLEHIEKIYQNVKGKKKNV